jgi:hypothetical protein
MSALGQKRKGSERANVFRFAPESGHPDRHIRLDMSGLMHRSKKHPYSITCRRGEEGERHIEVERLSGLEVDDQRELARLT